MTVQERTISSFLWQHDIEFVPVHLGECARFGLELPMVQGWGPVADHLFPHATAVLCSPASTVDGFVPNAVVLVGKLTRSVDPYLLLEHGFADSRALPGWVETSHDLDQFRGLPSVSIAGRYDWEGRSLFARTRYVVVHHIVDQYLVQVTVTLPDSLSNRSSRAVNEFVDEVRIGRE